jgi:hypothetical protein
VYLVFLFLEKFEQGAYFKNSVINTTGHQGNDMDTQKTCLLISSMRVALIPDIHTSGTDFVIDRSLLERRDRSLGCLTQRFLMLFFVSDTKIVGLDVAALILIGNMSPESAKWKTKVRRLYDIANILSSLQLIKKVRLPLRYGMKPAYQWVGTELDTAAQQYVAAERLPTTCKAPAKKRSYSKKHTLLDSFEAIPCK